MPNSAIRRYNIRLNEDMYDIDPEFADQWILPFYRQDGSFAPFSDTDFSPLSGLDALFPREIAEKLSALFPDLDVGPALASVPDAEELAEAALRHGRGEEGEAVYRLFSPLILSVSARYSRSREGLFSLTDVCQEALKEALDAYIPGWNGGYFHWFLRHAVIRDIWRQMHHDSWFASPMLEAEYRLADPGSAFAEPGEQLPSVAVSTLPVSCAYRYLRDNQPELFRDLMDILGPREPEILDLMMQENCLRTIFDAADCFSVSPERIHLTLLRFVRRLRSRRFRQLLRPCEP